MNAILFDNSVGWAQYKLLGGWKNLLATSIGYLVIGILVIYAMVKGLREPAQTVLTGMIFFFLVIQVIALLLYGTMRVGGAVRADVTAKLLESHRLMPTPPITAVLGYLFGSAAQALSFYLVTFVLGAVCVAGSGTRLQPWVFSNLVLLLFAVFVWMMVMFFSFRSGGAALGFVIGMAFMVTSSGAPLALLPAINVLLSPMIGSTIFDMRTGMALDVGYLIAAIVQVLLILIYLVASGRRYSRDDTLSFDAGLGLLLLAVWTAVSVLAIRRHSEFSWRPRGSIPWRYEEIAVVGSISSVLLLAILPVSSALRAAALPPRKRIANRGWHIPPWLTVIAALAVASLTILCVQPLLRQRYAELRTVIVATAFLVSARFMLGVAHRFKFGPRKFMIAWLFLTWLLPLVAETIRSATIADEDESRHMSQIGMISPPGELYQIWTRNPWVHTDDFTGLAVQCLIAVGAASLYYSTQPRSTRATS